MKKLAVLMMPVLLTACGSSIGTIGAKEADIVRSQTYLMGYDEAWESVVDWFAEQNIPIDKMEKESGLISSKHSQAGRLDHLDCGTPTGSLGLYDAKFDAIYGNLNVIIREKDEGTKVSMNLFGTADVIIRNGYGMVVSSVTEPCYSTGLLESILFDSIDN